MTCRDYIDLTELKAVWPGASAFSDTALAMMAFSASDYVDKAIFGHSFNRAVRIYHTKGHAATGCTVAVTTTEITIVIAGGVDAGTHHFLFATYTTLADIVAAINDADISVTATLLGGFAGWMPGQPSENLSLRSATSIYGIDLWAILCLSHLDICFDGQGEPNLYLPVRARSVTSVVVSGTALTSGTHYALKDYSYIQRLGTSSLCASTSGFLCTDSCECDDLGCWPCGNCNVCVAFIPLDWPPEYYLIGAAIGEVMKMQSTSGGNITSETIGKYSYTIGAAGMAYLNMLLGPLYGEGIQVGMP